ncbi:hypothetical protein Rsub_03535 [Raphidocelis subcapitata]|uniref:Uncharacterized protein n=1 Tax=Raphidocelis subcapitata TaxID=307507 RepID=A0A2V0NTA1_9CHLO|nr:hypothetical protein Rsub_03535 [Raphidocelis subcapitata]|eukprot:GBF90539.1 hypothetical protein Rsub_03535 [Raphidocelis subcapitata]
MKSLRILARTAGALPPCAARARMRLPPPAVPLPQRPAARRAPRHAPAAAGGAAGAAGPDSASGGVLPTACAVLAAGALAKAALGAAAPQLLLSFSLGAAAVTPLNTALTGAAAAVGWIYAAWLLALREAALHGRLASDTYKRLSLGMLGLAAVIAELRVRCAHTGAFEAGPFGSDLMLIITIAAVSAVALLASKLYSAGSGGRSPLEDARAAAAGVVAGVAACLQRPANIYSAAYAFHALTSLLGFCLLYPTSLAPLLPGGVDALGYYLSRAIGAGMLLQGVTAFTLKDAADRGRLGASTFKLLNLALMVTLLQQAWCMWSLSGAGVALQPALWRFGLAKTALVAAVCGAALAFESK